MKHIMIGTPVYDWKVEVDFMQSIFQTMELCMLNDIQLTLKSVIGCSLIQKARDELFRMAYEAEVDDLIFIDADQAWTQKDFGNLISPQVDLIGGAVVSKNDNIHYNVKTFEPKFEFEHTLINARAVGAGFFRMSRNCIVKMWDNSEKYMDGTKELRHVFETKVIDNELVGEDVAFCHKWRSLGGKVYVHPEISVSHIGKKRWDGNFEEYVRIANKGCI